MTKSRFLDDGKTQCQLCSAWDHCEHGVCQECLRGVRAYVEQRNMELIAAPDCPACGKPGAMLRHWSSPNGCYEKPSVVKRGD